MKRNNSSWLVAIAAIVLAFCLTSCATNNSSEIPETEYSKKIVGKWLGTVGDLKETMALNSDGTFICKVYPTGFIATTLSQGVKGTVSGTWKISGKIITLTILSTKNEQLENNTASSTIESFKGNELLLKSDVGETSLFQREISL